MFLYGAGGHAKVIIDILDAMGVSVAGIVDDNPAAHKFMDIDVFHEWTAACSPILISIGHNETRKAIAERLDTEGATFGWAVHPSAIISPHALIGEGSVVMQGCILQSCCCVGRHCIINTGASVDHECIIGDYAHISPHATLCGNVSVGEGTWIGACSVVIPGVKIGRWSVIGAGSVVCRDIPDGVVAYGSPCRVVRNR